MRSDRLLKLADYLKLVPRRAFNIRFWEDQPASKPEGEKLGECGFSGWAMGWAAHGKLFHGLKLEKDDGRASVTGAELYYRQRKGGVYESYDAPSVLFDISRDTAKFLFSPNENPYHSTPSQIAQIGKDF